MPLEDSPSLDVYKEGMPEKLPDQNLRHRQLLVVMGILLAIILIVEGVNFLRSPLGVILRGQATLQGQVVNQLGQPIPAEIIVLETRKSVVAGNDGRFVMDNVPAGQISVVAGYQGTGVEIPVSLNAGSNFDMGEIRLAATAIP
jgi:hypothetical protein